MQFGQCPHRGGDKLKGASLTCTCTNFRGNEKAQFYLSLNPLSFLSPTLSSHPPVTCHPPSCQPSLHPAQLPQSHPQFLPQSLPQLPAPSCRLPQRCGCLRCRSPTAAPVRRCTPTLCFHYRHHQEMTKNFLPMVFLCPQV